MQKLNAIISYIFILVLSAILAFYLYEVYRNFIMYLFDILQSGRITLIGKNFYIFPPVAFVASLGVFSCIMVYTLQKSSRKLLLIFISLLVFFTSSVLTTWLDSTGKIIECTACNDGRRIIYINDIAYSAHFAAALFFAAIPFAFSYWKRRKNNVDKA